MGADSDIPIRVVGEPGFAFGALARLLWWEALRGDPRQPLQLFRDRLDGLTNLLRGVSAADEEPQARGALRDCRMDDRRHVDAALEQRIGEHHALERAPDDHGN